MTLQHSRSDSFFPLLMLIRQKAIDARSGRLTTIPSLHRDKLGSLPAKPQHVPAPLFTHLSKPFNFTLIPTVSIQCFITVDMLVEVIAKDTFEGAADGHSSWRNT